MRAKMPRTIRLSGRRVKLTIEQPGLHINLKGVCDHFRNVIALHGSMPPDQLKATAVHEIVHDLDGMAGVEMTERDVCAFSSLLFAMIRDNPALIAWLQEE